MYDLGIKREAKCFRCKHKKKKYYDKPCCYCCNFDRWEKEAREE